MKGLGPGGAERLLLSFAETADHERFSSMPPTCCRGRTTSSSRCRWPPSGSTASTPRTPPTCGGRAGCGPWCRARLRRGARPLAAGGGRGPHRTAGTAGVPAAGPGDDEHNVWNSHRPVTRALNRATMRLDDHVFAVSDEVRWSMSLRRRERTEVLVHGADVRSLAARSTERTEARARLGLGEDDYVVVTVANLRSNKDYPTLLQAARTLLDRGTQATFLSVGQGPLEAELPSFETASDWAPAFRFLGYQSDPIGVLAAADVFCLASRFEGLPIALVEALAVGLPAIVTEVGAMPTVVARWRRRHRGPAGQPRPTRRRPGHAGRQRRTAPPRSPGIRAGTGLRHPPGGQSPAAGLRRARAPRRRSRS